LHGKAALALATGAGCWFNLFALCVPLVPAWHSHAVTIMTHVGSLQGPSCTTACTHIDAAGAAAAQGAAAATVV
jgi:hypothetical protein